MILAPRAFACSSSSKTRIAAPSDKIKPSLFRSNGLDAFSGVSLLLEFRACACSNEATQIGMIVASWIISPVIAGTFAFILFYLVKKYAFNTSQPYQMTLRIFPVLTFFTFLINGFFIFYKGTPALNLDKTELWVGIV